MKKFLEEVKGLSNSVTDPVEEMEVKQEILLTYDCGSEEDAEHFQAKADMVFVKHGYPYFTSCLSPSCCIDPVDEVAVEGDWTVVDYMISLDKMQESDKEKIIDIINDLDCI